MAIDKPLYRHETIVLDVSTRADYDAAFMQDRLIVEASDGRRKGYSAVRVEIDSEQDFLDCIDDFGYQMRRRAIDAALELGYAAELTRQAETIQRLGAEVRALRRPWYIKARDGLLALWGKVKAVYA